ALGGEVLRDVRIVADLLGVRIGLEEAGGVPSDPVRRHEPRVGVREGELDSLVAPDWTAEDDPLLRVRRGPVDEPARVPEALGGDQDPFRIEDVHEDPEALSFLPAPVPRGNLQTSKEWFVPRAVKYSPI